MALDPVGKTWFQTEASFRHEKAMQPSRYTEYQAEGEQDAWTDRVQNAQMRGARYSMYAAYHAQGRCESIGDSPRSLIVETQI
jgi:hypothetical protein